MTCKILYIDSELEKQIEIMTRGPEGPEALT